LLPVLVLAAVSLTAAACAGGRDAPQAAEAGRVTASAPPAHPTGYAGILAGNGIHLDIPPRGKFILVNIPAFELIALQDGVPALRSRVVVGRPATPTPELMSSMHAVRFNPSWTPTPAMIRNEGARFAPPGPNNPLGRILFELDNDELIFLHDTNDRSFFDRRQRALSHGCVRVQQARALAAWVLDVPEARIDAMVADRDTHAVPLPQPVPVSLVYHTRFPDQDGRIATYPDVYGHSQAMLRHEPVSKATLREDCHGPLAAAVSSRAI
jgi:murein L,D-transpeptidase YcbB/YkuD